MTKPPLSDDLVAKARAVVAEKQAKAMDRANGDGAEAARLLWLWTRQDPNLAASIVRVYCADISATDVPRTATVVPRGPGITRDIPPDAPR